MALGSSLLVLMVGLELGARSFLASPFGVEGELVGMYKSAAEPGATRSVPGWRGAMTVDGRSLPVSLNRLGLRGPELGPRAPDELRVLCLGDSFTFGYGVRVEEAFPAVLGAELSARLQRPVVTGNAGVPGYGVVEQGYCLTRLKPTFEPDVVVATIYLGNDFEDDQHVSKHVEAGFSVTGEWARVMRNSWRGRLMLHSRAWMQLELLLIESGSNWALAPQPNAEERKAFQGFPSRKHPAQCVAGLFMDVIDEQHSWDPANPEPVVPRVLARLGASLRTLRETAAPAELVVLILPSWQHLQPAERLVMLRRMKLDAAEYQAGLGQQRVRAVCERLGLRFVDAAQIEALAADPAASFLVEDKHFNARGHRLVAEALAEVIATGLR